MAPVASAAVALATEGELCPEAAYQPLQSERQNYSLAAEYYRNANADSAPETRRDAYCGAAVYLRWLVDKAPLYTGGEPDDRAFERLATVYEHFADEGDRRSRLDSALALRARGLRAFRASGAEPETWTRDLRESLFFITHADAYPDAPEREFAALRRAFDAQPDSLDDWYLRRLATASGEFIEAPEAHASFLEALAEPMDDSAYADYLRQLAVVIRTPVAATPSVSSLEPLLAAFARGDYDDCEPAADVRTLIGTASRLPEQVAEAGGEPDAVVDRLLDCVTTDIADPTQLYALFVRSWTRGDHEQAEAYYDRALTNAASGAERAEFAYARAVRGYGDAATFYRQATSYQATHAPSLFALARHRAESVGSPRGVRARAVYWCLADDFREIAAIGDSRVTSLARRAAEQYARSAPGREAYIFETDWKPGDTIRVTSGEVSCTTRVR
ncbi:hypothetical protein BSZ36_04850 [Rubricoccus marinus]|uniref:Uncharacterized protein n=1 Tax=Rubricoccus marinus TaxID=716817 RepID=A0A259TX79_9BACT|nr:hypothetical protein BSZ36_04850 [Rubricoccus marinus]